MQHAKSDAERLRLLGQLDLGAEIEVMTGEQLWSQQRKIAQAISLPRAKVAVPSCNASGKTWLAGRLALAFYNSFTPGTPCVQCGGPCRGAKVITTSSKESHLRDNLWGEIRTAYSALQDRGIYLPGRLFESDLRLVENEGNHFIVGQSAASAEGMQGYHAAHKLIIGDEATSVDEAVQLAITRLLASADSRILLIYNPTTPDTYASRMSRSGSFQRIKIRAEDTPAFTGEAMPPGANLITKAYLRDLEAQGDGPGTFTWRTSIEAEDWDLGDDVLISDEWYVRATRPQPRLGRGMRALGIDIASYGTDENVIAVRDGNQLVEVRHMPSMQTSMYVQGPVTKAVLDYDPDIVVYDADGVGAGAVGYFEDLRQFMHRGASVIGFRGGKGVNQRFANQRSAWYWMLRRRFENSGGIEVCVNNPILREQLTDIHYTVTDQGDIRVETKKEMRARGKKSPDRADAVMYSFAFADFLVPPKEGPSRVERIFGVTDHSDEAMWMRMRRRGRESERGGVNPVLGVRDDY